MMRLPGRLIATLARAGIARILNKSAAPSAIQWIDAAEILHPGSTAPVSHEKMQSLLQCAAPIIWIGGSEPLVHPGIGHFVRAIAGSGHYVFLETNGKLLRRRIHEFQPLPQIFLIVRLVARRDSDFDLAVEGLRAARLSGFLTAVHSVVGENLDLVELGRLRALFEELGVDGWLITAEPANPGALGKAADARTLMPRGSWRWLSRQVERELLVQATSSEVKSAPETREPHAASEEPCEESVKAV